MKKIIPVYDICTIDRSAYQDLLVERFTTYLDKHYTNLSRLHRHSFYHLVLFTSGKGSHTIDFEKYIIRPFQIYFMAPGQVHSWHFDDAVDGYIVHFNIELFNTFLLRSDHIQQFEFFKGSTESSVVNVPVDIQSKIQNIFESILSEIEGSYQNLDMIRVLLLQLFFQIDRCCVTRKQKNIPHQKLLMLNHFKQLIEKNFRLLKLPKEYAQLMYITPNHLNALCQEVIGKSAGELIRERIILEAKRLLTDAGIDVSEVAYDLAFQDNSYFTRFFKKYTGVTPEDFRKNISH